PPRLTAADALDPGGRHRPADPAGHPARRALGPAGSDRRRPRGPVLRALRHRAAPVRDRARSPEGVRPVRAPGSLRRLLPPRPRVGAATANERRASVRPAAALRRPGRMGAPPDPALADVRDLLPAALHANDPHAPRRDARREL